MEKKEGEDLPWFTSENFRQFSSSPRPQSNPRNPPVSQSHQFDSPARFFSRENHIPLPENNTIWSSQPKIDPFWPETYPSSIFPPSDIEAAFSRLNVSNPSGQAAAPSGQGSVMRDSELPAMSYVELNRQRVLSAATGQRGLGEEISTNYGLNSIEVPNLFTVMNPNPPRIRPSISQDAFGRVNTNLHRMGNRSEELNPRVLTSSLKDLRGKMFLMAKDQRRCRFLQEKLEEGKFENVEIIFLEIKDHIDELIVHRFGNYLTQKLFQVCNQEQITEMLALVTKNERQLLHICDNKHGTRAMQKLLENLTTPEQRSTVISVLRLITVNLAKSWNGRHVFQQCLKCFSYEENEHFLNIVAENCLDIAIDRGGCCVLQQCMAYAHGDAQDHLAAQIAANALVLSENRYGNYVVRHILEMRIPHVTANILRQLAESFVSLSMNKYGSRVVQKCLEESEEDQASQIIGEIVSSPYFLTVLRDTFGNYVAQLSLAVAKGNLRRTMIDQIEIHFHYLRSHPNGKRILAHARAISSSNNYQQ